MIGQWHQENGPSAFSWCQSSKAFVLFDTPSDDDHPRRVKEATWIRDFYYVHLRQFYIHKLLEQGVLSHRFESALFLPLVSLESVLEEEERAKASAGAR